MPRKKKQSTRRVGTTTYEKAVKDMSEKEYKEFLMSTPTPGKKAPARKRRRVQGPTLKEGIGETLGRTAKKLSGGAYRTGERIKKRKEQIEEAANMGKKKKKK